MIYVFGGFQNMEDVRQILSEHYPEEELLEMDECLQREEDITSTAMETADKIGRFYQERLKTVRLKGIIEEASKYKVDIEG